jgi:thiosulfate reductase cytochrome b subunit
VLLPLQVLTGLLMWGAQKWPQLTNWLGGLPFLAPLHTLVAWIFAAFIVGHVYLTTTGVTPLESIRGMITGWEEVEVHEEHH